MKFLKWHGAGLALLLVLVALSTYYYPQLPESIPTKFDFYGNPTQYSSKEFAAFFLPGIFLVVFVLTIVIIKASPEKFSMPQSRRSVDVVVFAIGVLFLFIHAATLMKPGDLEFFSKMFSFGSAFFLILLGNIFGKVERNFMIGIRVPWTLASEENWRATHRFGGKVMVIGGVLLLFISMIQPNMPATVLALLIPPTIPIFYSYRYFKTREIGVKNIGD